MSSALLDPAAPASTQRAIADCDIHHSPRDFRLLYPYLEARWRTHLDLFGQRPRQGNYSGPQYPKGQPDASRRDAWPPGGGRPGSNLDFMRSHHLDPHGVALGVLAMIRPHPGGTQNLDLSGAMCRAINDWQVAEWTGPEPRLKASIVVPYEDAAASVAEIERWAIAATGRSTKPPSAPACRSASTPSAMAASRPAAPAGAASISRT